LYYVSTVLPLLYLEGRTDGVVYEDDSYNFGKVLALRDDGELEPRVSTLKYLNYIISKEGIEARVKRNTIYSQCLVSDIVPYAFLLSALN
jgi:hypothetical protein